MSNVKIATAPCSWGVWYADGTPSGTPWELFLDQAAEAGYKALELGPDGYLPTEVDRLREELDKRGLEACAGTACYKFDLYDSMEGFRDRLDKLCARIAAFDAKYLVTMDESDSANTPEKKLLLTAEDWNRSLTMFREMGKYTLEKYGVETVFHPHLGTLIETEEEIERMMDFTGLRLCFDIGHHAAVNGSWQHGDRSAIDFMRKHPEKIAYLHYKNVNGEIRRKVMEGEMTREEATGGDLMCDLLDGIVDYNEVRDLMDEIGFDGIGVIEQDVPNATTDEAFEIAKRNLAYLREIGLIED